MPKQTSVCERSTKYYTLVQRHECGLWGIVFGDYDKNCVQDEMKDYVYNGGGKSRDFRILVTDTDEQSVIDVRIRELNIER